MKRPLLLVLSAALLLRLIVFFAVYEKPEIITSHDAAEYLSLAKNMVDNRVFSRSEKPPFLPEATRTPGYPAFITPFYIFFGNALLAPLLLSHIFIGVLTVFFTFILGKLFFGKNIGLIAAAFFALSPISIIMTGRAYSDTLFVCCFTLCIILLYYSLKFNKWLPALACGSLLSVTVLIRPICIVIIPAVFVIYLFRQPFGSGWKKAVIVLIVSMVLPLFWMQRNNNVFDRFSLASISGGNLLNYNTTGTEAHRRGVSFSESRRQLNDRLLSYDYVPRDSWPVSKKEALAREVIKEHPISFFFWNGVDSLKCMRPGFSFLLELFDKNSSMRSPAEIFREGNVPDILSVMRTQNKLLLILELFMVFFVVFLFCFVFAGIVIILRQKNWLCLFVLIIIPLGMMYVTGSAGSSRFRLPVEPLLSILAAVGFCGIIFKAGKLFNKETRR